MKRAKLRPSNDRPLNSLATARGIAYLCAHARQVGTQSVFPCDLVRLGKMVHALVWVQTGQARGFHTCARPEHIEIVARGMLESLHGVRFNQSAERGAVLPRTASCSVSLTSRHSDLYIRKSNGESARNARTSPRRWRVQASNAEYVSHSIPGTEQRCSERSATSAPERALWRCDGMPPQCRTGEPRRVGDSGAEAQRYQSRIQHGDGFEPGYGLKFAMFVSVIAWKQVGAASG